MGILEMSFVAHFMGQKIIVRTLLSRNSSFRISYGWFLNAVPFVWDFTITMQTKNLTDVSIMKLWSFEQNDKPGNGKNLFLSLNTC